MKFRLPIIFFLLFSATCISHAQYYDTGEDPASLKWQQIKTGRFTLIYPESYSKEALRYAGSLDSSYSKLSAFYSVKKTRFPVVIHNYTTFSNGYVAWAPKRMEIYPTPEQNTIPLDPVEQLTIHELTHIMEMYSLQKGFSGFMRYLIGEQATALASALMPMWFMEGDAVLAETALTPSGRGRTPYFQEQVKALVTDEKKLYSYDKMLLGSYKSFVPDHYQYGYQMIAWGYSKYNHKIWNNALDYTSKYPFSLYPVNFSNKKTTGLDNPGFYLQTFDSLKTIWSGELSKGSDNDQGILNPSKGKEYTNYYSPAVVGKDSIVAIKTSFSTPPWFVLVNTLSGSEERIHVPGDIYPWFISGARGKIVWVEQIPDPRWANRDYSIVKIMSLKTGQVVQLSRKSRYLAVSLSPDGRFVAAAENSVENRNSLVIIDAFNGQIINTIEVPGNIYLQRPQWSASGDEITAISLTAKGEGIVIYSIKQNHWKHLIEPGRDDLQASFLRNDSLFYVSSVSGTDNIYLLAPDGRRSMITDSRFGAYDPAFYNSKIYYSDYSVSGYNIKSTSTDNTFALKDPGFQKESFLINRFDTLRNKKIEVSQNTYKPEPYRKWQHPLRFHSWMPFYADIEQIQSDPTNISPGLSFLSQNTLSTLTTSVGYEYSNGNNLLHGKITWKGWVPVFEARVDYGGEPKILKLNNPVSDPAIIEPGAKFTSSISLPLSFSSGRFSQYFWSSFEASYHNDYIYIKETGNYDYGQTELTGRLYFSNQDQMAIRDIYPRWAQVIDLSTTSYPVDKSIYGTLNTIKTAIYFPGFIRNHSIKFRYEKDHQAVENAKLPFYNRASFPRGYKDIISLDLKFMSVDYAMPLIYPDLNIPWVFYLKRIRAGLFYDYSIGDGNFYPKEKTNQYHDYKETFRSFGTELLADFHILRIPFMISAGIQSAWKNFGEVPVNQFLFRIDVYGMKVGSGKL